MTLFNPLLRKLDRIRVLTEEERNAIRALPLELRHVAEGDDLLTQGQRPEGVAVLLSGVAIRVTARPPAARQIVGFCLPGDWCDLRVELVDRMDHSLTAVNEVVAGFIPVPAFNALLEQHTRLATMVRCASLVEQSIAREWIVNVGYRSAFERLGHLLCELYFRFEAVGLAGGCQCALPLRQTELADMLALSAVHVSRTMSEFRRRGLLTLHLGRLVIHNLPALCAASGFDPSYLHDAIAASSALHSTATSPS